MASDKTVNDRVIAIGIGCRAGASAANIVSLVQRALAETGIDGEGAKLFTIDMKRDEIGLLKASRLLAMPIVFLPRDVLSARAGDALTRSDRVRALYGVPSIAETAALAGAGTGSCLVVPRLTAGAVTCAIAIGSR
jgi:cobalt-precorrin 5A hydrolase